MLLLIPQRYEFSSKSQLAVLKIVSIFGCCWYHKGTNFQANHNVVVVNPLVLVVVADTTKVRIFKQITTYWSNSVGFSSLLLIPQRYEFSSKSQRCIQSIFNKGSCCWYHKGTNFQANHNALLVRASKQMVVADTTKVRIFKQITTTYDEEVDNNSLLLIPQRYEFSSKSQQSNGIGVSLVSCCWYHKGTNFQANHNKLKQELDNLPLLLIPQRYKFSSKSQPSLCWWCHRWCCCWYHKGTNFQANHNRILIFCLLLKVVADTTKVRIFKQITTNSKL